MLAHSKLSLAIAICSLLCISSFTRVHAEKPVPFNVAETNKAWDCINASDWQGASQHADTVINQFSKLATGMHDMLAARIKRRQAEVPPIGTPTDAEKVATFKYGLMNDVATCYYIKAKALYNLYRQSKDKNADDKELSSLRSELKHAYDSCLQYPLARCWDPKGFFWSPAKGVKNDIVLSEVGL